MNSGQWSGPPELTVAVDMVQQAAEIARGRFGASMKVDHKADGSEVTRTDRDVEDLLRRRLAERFPSDAVSGEEFEPVSGSSGRRWVIDPLGGTADFVRRVPLFAIDLALEEAGRPLVAVTALPMSGMVLCAGKGAGSWILRDGADPQPGHVDDRTSLDGVVVCTHNLKGWSEDLLLALHQRVSLRDGVHAVRRLVTGEAQAIVHAGARLDYEDLACLPLLVQEAGGRVTDFSGRPALHGDGTVLATNGALHEDFLKLLDGLPTGR